MSKSTVKTKSGPDINAKPPKTVLTPNDAADSGSMEKIRDILFGNQMRDYERRFARMEEQVAQAMLEIREENQKRLEALEFFFKEELAALKDRIKAESDQRGDGDKKLNEELQKASASISKAITQVEEKLSERATELRQQILQQSKQLSTEIQMKNDQTAQDLKKTAEDLEESKINRSALAEYLVEMAMRLSDHEGAISTAQNH